jgi:uncharacterized protein (DUF1499 family)
MVGLLAGGAMLVGAVLAWLRVVPGMVGFGLYALGGLVCLVVAVGALVGVVRGRGMPLGGVVALAAGGMLVVSAMRGAGLPRTNDFTTDLGDPPAFRHATTLAPNAGRSLEYPAAFAAEQQACCADLRPARLAVAPAAAFARAQASAERMPSWVVTFSDPATGSIEAVATSAVFGFQDDVVIRVRADAAGAGSIVDVRSKSRDGKGDLGVNADRIRAFVARVEQEG